MIATVKLSVEKRSTVDLATHPLDSTPHYGVGVSDSWFDPEVMFDQADTADDITDLEGNTFVNLSLGSLPPDNSLSGHAKAFRQFVLGHCDVFAHRAHLLSCHVREMSPFVTSVKKCVIR